METRDVGVRTHAHKSGAACFGASPSFRAKQQVFAAFSDQDLDALVAPIALYPDALVAQILGAATYPDQVVEADTFLKRITHCAATP
jgi:hypothetical protein